MTGNNDIDTRLWDFYIATIDNHGEFLDNGTEKRTSSDSENEDSSDNEFLYT